jgi:hypothetical protein
MMGIKERNFQPLPANISLEYLLPNDNSYQRLERSLDLSCVRDLVKDRYASSGRHSVDPEVFFRLQLVMFFEGIRSERQLMRAVAFVLLPTAPASTRWVDRGEWLRWLKSDDRRYQPEPGCACT